jgi:DNA (cytosine-5)-methyltransferase 1
MANNLFDTLTDISQVMANGKRIKTVSLFSGCGGMDMGFMGDFTLFGNKNKKYFSRNSFEIIWANDIDKGAVETYKSNIGNHIQEKDISLVSDDEIPNCDVVIGGFPCQDFSIAGKQRGFNSERGNLYKQMIRVIKNKKPKAFVAENVKNILNPKLVDTERNQPVIKTIIEDFENLGYVIQYKCVNAPDYGIPQRRERVFIVGIRKDIKAQFFFPKPIHSQMTSKQAIDDLWGKEANPEIFNHNQMSLATFRPPSKNGMQGNEMIPANAPSHTMRAEHHMNIQAHYRTLSPTKDSSDRKFWRRLTVREAARLQTFPDQFKFEGSKSDCYKQVGNAVPPMLGWYIAKALEKCLLGTHSNHK